MERTTVFWVAVLVAAATVPMPVAGQSDKVTLTVTVVDEQGQPVPGATISASWDGGNATETTRSNGQALIDVDEGADVALDVESDRYIRNEPLVVEDATERRVDVTVAPKGSATITVTDRQGDRVGDAVVRMWQDGDLIVNRRAGADGVFETGTIEQGDYDMVVFKQGYFKNRSDLTVDGAVERTVGVETGSVVVRFAVTDDHYTPPEPVQGASIEVGDIGTVRTLSNGEATLQVPVNGRYAVAVSKENYTAETPAVDVGEQRTTVNVSINREPGISIAPSADRVVRGESVSIDVTDEYGAPVPNATVTLDGADVGTTDADGELAFPVESAGAHTIGATAGDLQATYEVRAVEAATSPAETTAAETTTAEDTASGTGPGFTAVAALAALLATALLARRRR